jgi:hypothetical protein
MEPEEDPPPDELEEPAPDDEDEPASPASGQMTPDDDPPLDELDEEPLLDDPPLELDEEGEPASGVTPDLGPWIVGVGGDDQGVTPDESGAASLASSDPPSSVGGKIELDALHPAMSARDNRTDRLRFFM